ncbi:hypothetical protein LSH36_399g07040, partial [Paralvinella palmiformis]
MLVVKKSNVPDRIFNEEILSVAQCQYVCIQNDDCLALMYDEVNHLCHGYKSQEQGESLRENTNIWLLINEAAPSEEALISVTFELPGPHFFRKTTDLSEDKRVSCLEELDHSHGLVLDPYAIEIAQPVSAEKVNLTLAPGTSCSASSVYLASYRCSNVYDGIVKPTGYNEWSAESRGGTEWIRINFRSSAKLFQLEVWHKCALVDQVDKIKLEFSNGYSRMVDGTCDGLLNRYNCTGQARFSRYDVSPALVTEWVKLTSVVFCVPQNP